MKFTCHLTSRNRMVRGICDFAFRHVTVKFDSHGSRKKEFVTLFVCYMTLCDYVINRLCDFVDNKPALEPTTLSALVAIGIAKVEILRFLSVT